MRYIIDQFEEIIKKLQFTNLTTFVVVVVEGDSNTDTFIVWITGYIIHSKEEIWFTKQLLTKLYLIMIHTKEE